MMKVLLPHLGVRDAAATITTTATAVAAACSLPVEADDLLPQHGVHGLLVHDGVLLYHGRRVKVRGQLGQDVLGQLVHHRLRGSGHTLVLALALSACRAGGGSKKEVKRKKADVPTCGDLAPPPDCRGRVSRTPSSSWFVSWLSLVMSALLCRPNTQGSEQMGRPRMYST